MVLSCRFYGERFPEIEDVVMVNVKSIGEMGAYVHLLEYKNIEGMILLSELSRRRIRSINKLIRVGRNECVVVIRVDKDKGYIDLSKRRVSPEDITRCEEKFARGKTINSILRHVGEILHYNEQQLEELYEKTAWYFDRKANKPTASYDVFKAIVQNPSLLDECNLEQNVKELMLTHIQRRLMPQTIKVRSEIEVGCYAYEGVEAIKRSLKAGMAIGTEEMPIKVNLIAAPRYVVTTNTIEKEAGVELLKKALCLIEGAIKASDGIFTVVQEPKVVTEIDEEEFHKQMEKAIKENALKSGDDDDDEDSDDVEVPIGADFIQ